jgi:uncharacterized SAM-binding protein YcdF (DUF218 family)
VLGCKVSSLGLSPAADRRVATAAAAFRRGAARIVLAAGGRRWGDVVEAVEMGRSLEARGVPRDRITLELASLSTLENARFCAEILARMGVRDALLVTCDWHAPRALRDFESFGLRVSAILAESPRLGAWARLRRDAREACSDAIDARFRERIRRSFAAEAP